VRISTTTSCGGHRKVRGKTGATPIPPSDLGIGYSTPVRGGVFKNQRPRYERLPSPELTSEEELDVLVYDCLASHPDAFPETSALFALGGEVVPPAPGIM
jgi:hypothetical protein